MRFAVISDTHFGDPECTLAYMDSFGNMKDGCNLPAFCDTIGKDNDFIIILGDMLDFAINDYEHVYKIARHFFMHLKQQGIIKADGNVIYSPGNHDYDVWHTIEYEANIINRMKRGEMPQQSRMSVPLILDDRTEQTERLHLHGVFRKTGGGQPYGGMFLDSLISPDDPINFVIPFPNIYFVNNETSILMTHGQYFESYWAIVSEIYGIITQKTGVFSMKDFIAVNFPLGQLGSSGVGQAGPLTETILEIEKDVSSGNCTLTKKYIRRLANELLKHYDIPYVPKIVERLILEGLTDRIIKELKKVRNSNFLDDLSKNKGTQSRVTRFLDSSLKEISEIQKDICTQYRPIDTLLFGHTHQPLVDADKASFEYGGKKIKLWNTGGWLRVSGDDADRYGGEIFLYETGKGFTSKKISVTHS